MTADPAPPRPIDRRRADTLARWASDVDCWVPSASADGRVHLVPLSFVWWDGRIVLSTDAGALTARRLLRAGVARLGFGPTRDVVMVDGTVEGVPAEHVDEVAPGLGDAFAVKSGFDPRTLRSPYVYLLVTPTRVQAWREENELAEREVLGDGGWLVGT